MSLVTPIDHQRAARRIKQLYAEYMAIKPMLPLGGYVAGTDPLADKAVEMAPAIHHYLQQEVSQAATLEESVSDLAHLAQH